MKKALIIDCTMREASRTRKLLEAFRRGLDPEVFAIETLKLDELDLQPLMKERYRKRDALLASGKLDDPMLDPARQFASADLIAAAAPFWDLSFPSLFKIYIENISVEGITFAATEQGLKGLCRAEKFVYLTTRGGFTVTGAPEEQATPYLSALRSLLGFKDVVTIAAKGLDVYGYDGEGELNAAIAQAEKLAGELSAN